MADADGEHRRALERVLRDVAERRGRTRCRTDVAATSTDGANFTSLLFRGCIAQPGYADIKFFAKVAAVGEVFRSQLPTQIFLAEQFAYTRLAEIFEKIQNDNNISEPNRLRLPLLLGYDNSPPREVLVLEDLGAEGYYTHDRLQSFEWTYAAASVRQLAIMHSLSIAMQHNYPQEYDEVSKTLLLKKFNPGEDPGAVKQMISKAIGITREENRERLMNYVQEKLPQVMNLFYEVQRRPVLVHGDFRPSNTMHKDLSDGTCDVVIIDYQTLHIGSVAKDLMYFIFTGSDAAFRRQHYQALLDYYYQNLSLALRRLRLNPDIVFPREDFDYEVNEAGRLTKCIDQPNHEPDRARLKFEDSHVKGKGQI
ncbi:hypothetical protein ACJJTC_005703 [Scirpophaga incertulas]